MVDRFSILDTIDQTLDVWEAVKRDNNLTDDMIAYGKRILEEAKQNG